MKCFAIHGTADHNRIYYSSFKLTSISNSRCCCSMYLMNDIEGRFGVILPAHNTRNIKLSQEMLFDQRYERTLKQKQKTKKTTTKTRVGATTAASFRGPKVQCFRNKSAAHEILHTWEAFKSTSKTTNNSKENYFNLNCNRTRRQKSIWKTKNSRTW